MCLLTSPQVKIKQKGRNIHLTLIKFQILGITKFTGASHLFDNESNCKKYTEHAYADITPSQEIILSTKPVRCCENERFLEFIDVEVYGSTVIGRPPTIRN